MDTTAVPNSDRSNIPGELTQRLVELRPVLENNGTVVQRRESDRRGGYRLRYRACGHSPDREGRSGPRPHRSLSLVDEGTAVAVAALLKSWRAEAARTRQAARDAEAVRLAAERAERAELKQKAKLPAEFLAGFGGRRMQRRIAREYADAVANGPVATFVFATTSKSFMPRKAGRPRKTGLSFSFDDRGTGRGIGGTNS